MNRYLVIQLARFGDIIQTSRLIFSLLQDGEVHLCVDTALIEIAKIIYPKCVVHGISVSNGSFYEQIIHNIGIFTELKRYDYTQIFNLNYSGMNFAFVRLFPAEIVKGYSVKNGQLLRDTWMKMAFRWTEDRKYSPLNLVDFWGLLASYPIAPQYVNPPAKPGGKGLGVVLAGRNSRRSLPPEFLVAIINILFESVDGDVIYFLGSKEEKPLGRQLISLMPNKLTSKIENKAGKTNWHDLVDIVSNLDLVLTPDTGTMHLAARLGVPVCAMFLSSAWAWETGPYGLGHQVWQTSIDCAPCAEATPCPRHVQCLDVYRTTYFFRCLSGRSQELPSDLLLLRSSFDELGLIWESNGDTTYTASIRMAQHALIKEYQGLSFARSTMFPEIASSHLVNNLYLEADWMLPNSIL